PGALSLDFTEAEAAVAAGGSASDWGLPGTAVITVAPAVSGSVAVITWDPVTGFNPAADSPQTLTVTGTIAGGLPQGITDPNGVIRPFEVEITVAAP
ncbi:MAG: hypothetical protein FWF80_06570, partial [Defluviitaleaceae bacterium]|nr:hypothetical protein [Defluviitaleaceae bacterium]